MFLKAHLLSTNTPDNASTLIMVQCSAVHIKESSLRRVGGGGLGSLGPLTHTGEEGPHSHGSGGTSLTRARSQEGPHQESSLTQGLIGTLLET